MKQNIHFHPDFEKIWGYDSTIDYNKVIEQCNTFASEGNWEAMRGLLDIHGGKIALIMKREYQKQQTAKQQER